MPAPSYKDSKEKLIEDMRGTDVGQFDVAKAILEVKGQEEIALHTKQLTRATWVLALATVGLFFATVALIYVTVGSR